MKWIMVCAAISMIMSFNTAQASQFNGLLRVSGTFNFFSKEWHEGLAELIGITGGENDIEEPAPQTMPQELPSLVAATVTVNKKVDERKPLVKEVKKEKESSCLARLFCCGSDHCRNEEEKLTFLRLN